MSMLPDKKEKLHITEEVEGNPEAEVDIVEDIMKIDKIITEKAEEENTEEITEAQEEAEAAVEEEPTVETTKSTDLKQKATQKEK